MIRSPMITSARGGAKCNQKASDFLTNDHSQPMGQTKSNQSKGDSIADYLKEEDSANADNIVINLTTRFIFRAHLGILTSQRDT